MDIGIAKENRPQEKRVIIEPEGLRDIALIHAVYVEQGAGVGVGIKDEDYVSAGAKIVDTKIKI